MTPKYITAIIPTLEENAPACIILDNYGNQMTYYCTVNQYINQLARLTGNSHKACRKLFPHMRATGLRFNDATTFLALKMTDTAPSLGYVRYDAIQNFEPQETGCLLHLKKGHPIPIHWSLPTVVKHIARLQKAFGLRGLPFTI